MLPFFRGLPPSSRAHVYLGDWGPGHAAPPRELLTGLLDRVVRSRGDWQSALDLPEVVSGDGIVPLLTSLQQQPAGDPTAG